MSAYRFNISTNVFLIICPLSSTGGYSYPCSLMHEPKTSATIYQKNIEEPQGWSSHLWKGRRNDSKPSLSIYEINILRFNCWYARCPCGKFSMVFVFSLSVQAVQVEIWVQVGKNCKQISTNGQWSAIVKCNSRKVFNSLMCRKPWE